MNQFNIYSVVLLGLRSFNWFYLGRQGNPNGSNVSNMFENIIISANSLEGGNLSSINVIITVRQLKEHALDAKLVLYQREQQQNRLKRELDGLTGIQRITWKTKTVCMPSLKLIFVHLIPDPCITRWEIVKIAAVTSKEKVAHVSLKHQK